MGSRSVPLGEDSGANRITCAAPAREALLGSKGPILLLRDPSAVTGGLEVLVLHSTSAKGVAA